MEFNPDLLLNHIDKIEVNLDLGGSAELFTYDQSDELKMSDFAKKIKGTCSIRQEYSCLVLEFMTGIFESFDDIWPMIFQPLWVAREEEDTDEGGSDNEDTDNEYADEEIDEDSLD